MRTGAIGSGALRRWAACAVLLAIAGLVAASARADGDGPLYTERQRFGVCVVAAYGGISGFPGQLSNYAGAESLGFGWYSDWRTRANPETPNGIEYAQLVGTRSWPPNWTGLEANIRANPGALWIIGNEPETRGQGQHTPAEYAVRYHDFYYFIKSIDPTARTAIGGVVMPTPLRLQWLDLLFSEYQARYSERLPVEIWNIHMQILQEKRGDWGCGIPYGLDDIDEGRLYEIADNASVPAFVQLIEEFSEWLVARGERDKPVIISEYGVLFPDYYFAGGQQTVINFMLGTFDYMLTARDPRLGYAADENRLVQRWMWFSLNFPSDVIKPAGAFGGEWYNWRQPDQLTAYGRAFRDYVAPLVNTPTPTPTLARVRFPLVSKGYRPPTMVPTLTRILTPTGTLTPTHTRTVKPTVTATDTPMPSETPTPSTTPMLTIEPTLPTATASSVATVATIPPPPTVLLSSPRGR